MRHTLLHYDRQLAKHCDYKDTLQETLHDRLICGVNQKCLLAEKDLTFDKALDIAKRLETAEKGHSGSQVRYRCTQFKLSLHLTHLGKTLQNHYRGKKSP